MRLVSGIQIYGVRSIKIAYSAHVKMLILPSVRVLLFCIRTAHCNFCSEIAVRVPARAFMRIYRSENSAVVDLLFKL